MAPSRAFALSAILPRLRPSLRTPPQCCTRNCSRPQILSRTPLRITKSPAVIPRRFYSSQESSGPEAPDHLSQGELHVFNKVKAELEPVKLEVQDVSGGCGSMYAIEIISPKFAGLSVIKQHKLVNSVLADEIKSWHGVQLRTKAA